MTITILAIDGQGHDTRQYLDLLQDTANIFPATALKLLTSDVNASHNLVKCVHIPKLDYLTYSRLCVEELTNFVQTDHVLCIQLDGFIINPDLWQDKYLAFDYVGAPWHSKKGRSFSEPAVVGNGGFSLRSKKLLDATAKLKWHPHWQGYDLPAEQWGNEDYFISVINRDTLDSQGIQFAPVDIARHFSVQKGDPLGHFNILSNVFGFHGVDLLGKVRRHVEKQGIYYKHLKNVKKSLFPLRY